MKNKCTQKLRVLCNISFMMIVTKEAAIWIDLVLFPTFLRRLFSVICFRDVCYPWTA